MRLRVLLITDRHERAALIEQALTQARHTVVACIQPDDDIRLYVRQTPVDALVVEVDAPSSGLLRQLQQQMHESPLPVAVFVDRSDSESIRLAMRLGLGAFVVDGFRPSRVTTVLEAARLRFSEIQTLRRERDAAVARLSARVPAEPAEAVS